MSEQPNPYAESEYLIIPNPIYDVVFRWLMEDLESAKIVLSTLIGEKIIALQLDTLTHAEKKKNQREVTDPLTKDDLRLFHLDFTATVEYPDGREELIMIELQKASEPDDIFRFKRYISKNFQKKRKTEIYNPVDRTYEIIDTPIRLIPIFILNFRIENEVNDLFIRIKREKEGVFKKKQLQKHNEFIDHLTYDMFVVQLPNLSKIKEEDYKNDEYKERLYSLLKLFDQKSKVKNNAHRLRLIRKFFPGFLDRVIKRLQAADINNPDLEQSLYDEDEYLRALIKRDNKIISYAEVIKKTKSELEEERKLKAAAKAQAETAKSQAETAKAQAETAKAQADAANIKLAKRMLRYGESVADIQVETGLSKAAIEALKKEG